ncbi:MFS transporter [Skermania sp. ID1734]|uniref:MFS transporter n=1 Tax=Skermania sp. ID1734 TaxID=2597516 RepID=UPI00117CABE3|nr:MFS transporter [Skermania sp. ID1734]TSE00772.1 MFS transporter [Skermania sp. ID1734]
MVFSATRDLIPLYGLYEVLFADHGLSTAQISSLLAIWSLTGFVLEVPSGAWADTVSRRALLILGSALLALGFAIWTLVPSYWGFAAGFVLWGTSGALQSGTFEALLYDELTARCTTDSYARIIGYSTAAGETAALLATLTAAPMYSWGGYGLVGWLSVGAALVHCLAAGAMPSAPKALEVADSATKPVGAYLGMLRSGAAEFLARPRVRFGVLLAALLYGFTAFDEYFGLLARAEGVAIATIPLLVGITLAGQVVGTALAGRTAAMRARTMVAVLLAAAGLLAIGALLGGPGVIGALGFVALGTAYGAINNAVIVTEVRLQEAITGAARATVTSVASLFSELVALAVFGAVALVSMWFSLPTVVALLGIPVALAATAVPRWLPRHQPRRHAEVEVVVSDSAMTG